MTEPNDIYRNPEGCEYSRFRCRPSILGMAGLASSLTVLDCTLPEFNMLSSLSKYLFIMFGVPTTSLVFGI